MFFFLDSGILDYSYSPPLDYGDNSLSSIDLNEELNAKQSEPPPEKVLVQPTVSEGSSPHRVSEESHGNVSRIIS